jgi:DNA-binding MarR family transcriptional regulator
MKRDQTKYNPDEIIEIPQNVRFDPELTAAAKLFYAELRSFCKDGSAPFHQRNIAKMLKVSYPSVINWTNKLVEKGYIEIMLNTPQHKNKYKVKIKK